jgi:hypothetical protein
MYPPKIERIETKKQTTINNTQATWKNHNKLNKKISLYRFNPSRNAQTLIAHT